MRCEHTAELWLRNAMTTVHAKWQHIHESWCSAMGGLRCLKFDLHSCMPVPEHRQVEAASKEEAVDGKASEVYCRDLFCALLRVHEVHAYAPAAVHSM